MTPFDFSPTSLYEQQEKKDRLRIIKNLKKQQYHKALKLLSYYKNVGLSKSDDSGSYVSKYFFLIHSAYAHFGLNQHSEAKSYLEEILNSQPLDGPSNLFIAYIDLLENDKPRAIHRYSTLLENPFYRSTASKILEKIRYSNSLTDLLSSKSGRFFYKHDFPNVFWEECEDKWERGKEKLKKFLLKVKEVYFFEILSFFRFRKSNRINFFNRKHRSLPKKFLISLLVLSLLIVSYLKIDTIELWWKEKMIIPFSKKETNIFSDSLKDNYGEEKVEEWSILYLDMKEKINLHQFNIALKIYNKINSNEDLPLEVKNKFYILSTFITLPQFDELTETTSFADIDLDNIKNPIGLYYKFKFKILKISKANKIKFLVELINHNSMSDIANSKSSFSFRKAVLVFVSKGSKTVLMKIGEEYEAISQLQTQENNYLVFNTLVVRSLVKATRE